MLPRHFGKVVALLHIELDDQCTYIVTLRRALATIVAVEQQ
jgi:hypothetical protein